MSLPEPPHSSGLTSIDVLGISLGGFLIIIFSGSALVFLKARMSPYSSQSQTQIHSTNKPSIKSSTDLEVGLPTPNRPGYTNELASLHKKEIPNLAHNQNARENIKSKISRPTRLLPLDASSIVVQNPLRLRRKTLIESYLPKLTQSIPSRRTHSLHLSINLRRTSREPLSILRNKPIPVTQAGIKPAPLNSTPTINQFTHKQGKRTLVWFDEPSIQIPISEELHSPRTLRSNSFPICANSSVISSSRSFLSRDHYLSFSLNPRSQTTSLGSKLPAELISMISKISSIIPIIPLVRFR
ncbi:hypothetical protein O181_090094 [Austropuccinia psidii MF-1]|uniref:Uncharacterized protein n=1 Tax=Austropuccinia psidii MF-1 TaxID=1389203 RepID=A0A9Q3IUS2_9BASI|nr:hypothetical protein [Austropuccinia psidii MF-1]